MRCTMAHTSAKLDWKDEGIHSSKGGTSPPLLKPVAPFSSSPPFKIYQCFHPFICFAPLLSHIMPAPPPFKRCFPTKKT